MTYRYHYGGKPKGHLQVARKYVEVDASRWTPPVKGLEFSMLYLNVTPTFLPGNTGGALRVRLERMDDEDMTAYHDYPIRLDCLDGKGAQLITHTYFELGDAQRTRFWVRCQGGLASARIGTRYRKGAVVPK